MPKRGAVALALTSLALVLLFAFKTPDVTPLAAGRNTALFRPAATSAPASTGGPAAAPLSATGTAPQVAPRASAAAPAASPTPGSGGAALANGTVTGSLVQTRFGPVQVQVTIANGKIADISALQLPFDRQRSAEISQVVAPMLRSEALAAQSAQIDLISGATYTSDGYAQSLQSALDQATHG